MPLKPCVHPSITSDTFIFGEGKLVLGISCTSFIQKVPSGSFTNTKYSRVSILVSLLCHHDRHAPKPVL